MEHEELWQYKEIAGTKEKEIVKAKREAMRPGQNFQVKELMLELNILMDKEAQMWLQRSKVQWAKYGDRNVLPCKSHSKTLTKLNPFSEES